jgi:prophage DNA circulation protein
MSSIKDISNPWRDDLVPAAFDGNEFYVETGSRTGGRRIVVHSFPKKDIPYAEDMGKRAIEFPVRAYCIQSALQRDYRPQRDALQARLDKGGPGDLQLPTMRPMQVVCQRYLLREQEELGGYCTFDIVFVEAGAAPFKPATSARASVQQKSSAVQSRVTTRMAGGA